MYRRQIKRVAKHAVRANCLPDMARLSVTGPYHVSDHSFSGAGSFESLEVVTKPGLVSGPVTALGPDSAATPRRTAGLMSAEFPGTHSTHSNTRRMAGDEISNQSVDGKRAGDMAF